MANLLKTLNYTQASGLTFISYKNKRKFINGEWANFNEIDISPINDGYFFVGEGDSWRVVTNQGQMLEFGPFTTEEKNNLPLELKTKIITAVSYELDVNYSVIRMEGKSYNVSYVVDKISNVARYGVEFANGKLVPTHFTVYESIENNVDDILVCDEEGKWGVINSDYADTRNALVAFRYASAKNALVAYNKLVNNTDATVQEQTTDIKSQEAHEEKEPDNVAPTTEEDSNTEDTAKTGVVQIVSKKLNGRVTYGVYKDGKRVIPEVHAEIKLYENDTVLIKSTSGKWGVKTTDGQTLVNFSCKSEEGAINAYKRRLVRRAIERTKNNNNEKVQDNEPKVKEPIIVEEEKKSEEVQIPTQEVDEEVIEETKEEMKEEAPVEEPVEEEEVKLVNGIDISIFKEGKDIELVARTKAHAIERIKESVDKDEIDSIVVQFKAFVEQMIEAKAQYEKLVADRKAKAELEAKKIQAIEKCEEIASGYGNGSELETGETVGV